MLWSGRSRAAWPGEFMVGFFNWNRNLFNLIGVPEMENKACSAPFSSHSKDFAHLGHTHLQGSVQSSGF